MKILESQSATLSNKEVLAHIRSLRSKPHSSPPKIQNFETVIKELTEYLSAPLSSSYPSNQFPSSSSSSSLEEEELQLRLLQQQTKNQIKSLLMRLQCYDLTKAELLMIINLAPEELGLLDCIIEECDLRFSEDEQQGILEVVGDVLLPKKEGEGGE